MTDITDAIDVDRIQRRLDDLHGFGNVGAGVTCLAYSEEENRAFAYLENEIPDEFDVRTDDAGNLFASPDLDADTTMMVGSHLDSVRNGGRLDGKLGVVTGLEAIQAIVSADVDTVHTPVLAAFRGEETARFSVGLVGSRAALGKLTDQHLDVTDSDGTSLRDAMHAAGFDPATLDGPTIDLSTIHGFLELHIEQGPVLFSEEIPIGIVTEVRGPLRNMVDVRGEANHSGATPMGKRKDALAAAAEMITAIEQIGEESDKKGDVVTTVGYVETPDGSANKVLGEARFPIDIRSTDVEFRSHVNSTIHHRIRSVSDRRGLQIDIDEMLRVDPVSLDEDVIDRLAEHANSLDIPHKLMASGGGHDAMNFSNEGISTGLVFVPCEGGLSHNPNERTTPEAIAAGTSLLAHSLAYPE